MNEIHLDDYEKDLVRFLAKHYDEEERVIAYSDFPQFDEFGWNKIQRIADRFKHFGWLEGFASDSAEILPTILDIAHELDNPPPKHYLNEINTWFLGKWWSIPVFVIIVGLPALVGYVTMIKTLLQWMGILE